MIIKSIDIEKFRAFEDASFCLGKRITAIAGRNATQKTTVLGMIGQPFTISSKDHRMYGCKTIDGYNFRSQFREKFKISPVHDVIGEHKWKLNLHNGIHENDSFVVESIARRQSGRSTTLRFWNAESRARGAGYVQLPVYFLSLGRLFPIGEIGKTQTVVSSLTNEEMTYCINKYRVILSIQNSSASPSVGIEKAASKTFAGISDDIHDIFTNSAGEGNVTRIILAVLSFKRLKEQYGRDYKGGILLIDEVDATLYGFSQTKLIDYLWEAAGAYNIQIVFTTHSPIILKAVNKYQRKERQNKGVNRPVFSYDASIVYLEPKYDQQGKRTIMPKNICTSSDLNLALNDINLAIPMSGNKLNVYCEDNRAISFLSYLLNKKLGINLELYMSFVEIDLGWTNYVQLASKKIPEFISNIIVLDGDVPGKDEYQSKKPIIEKAGNFLFLPLVIEKSMFMLLKDFAAYSRFQNQYSAALSFNYDTCFNNWPLGADSYKTKDFKDWYAQVELALGNQNVLFDFWISENIASAETFVEQFVALFNNLADKKDVDGLPKSDDSIDN